MNENKDIYPYFQDKKQIQDFHVQFTETLWSIIPFDPHIHP